jgi:hypothetical protein
VPAGKVDHSFQDLVAQRVFGDAAVHSENSVRFENAEVTIIREMMVASTMNSVLWAKYSRF